MLVPDASEWLSSKPRPLNSQEGTHNDLWTGHWLSIGGCREATPRSLVVQFWTKTFPPASNTNNSYVYIYHTLLPVYLLRILLNYSNNKIQVQ